VESVNPAAPGEDVAEHFTRLLREADESASIHLDPRGPQRMLSADFWLEIEPMLAEFLKPYVEEAIKARPITVKVEDPEGAAERQRIIAYLGRRRTDGLQDSITLATVIGEIQRGEHLAPLSVPFEKGA
jgi:hypothetical protein